MYLFHRPLLCEGIIYKHCLLALFSPFDVVPIVCDGGVNIGSLFCGGVLGALSSLDIILLRKGELVALCVL